MSTLLALLFVTVLTDKSNLSVLVSEVGSDVDKVKIAWHKQNSVTLVFFVDTVPDLLGEEAESCRISVLKIGNFWKSSQGDLDLLLIADLLRSIRVHFRKVDGSKYVEVAVLGIDELQIIAFELLHYNVLSHELRKFR